MARPSTRRTPVAVPADGPVRPAVRDFTGGAVGHVIEWDVRPVYDFLFSSRTTRAPPRISRPRTGAGSRTPGQPSPRPTARPFGASPSPTCRSTWERSSWNGGTWPPSTSWSTSIESRRAGAPGLGASSPRPWRRTRRRRRPAPGPAASTATPPQSAMAARGGPPRLERSKDRLAELKDPAATHASIVGLVRAWAEQFRPIEERVRGDPDPGDYDLRAGDRSTLTGPDLIERTTGGVRWLPEAGIRRVILAPSYFSRPVQLPAGGQGLAVLRLSRRRRRPRPP